MHAASMARDVYLDVHGFFQDRDDLVEPFEESAEGTLYHLSGEYGDDTCRFEDVKL